MTAGKPGVIPIKCCEFCGRRPFEYVTLRLGSFAVAVCMSCNEPVFFVDKNKPTIVESLNINWIG